MSADVAEEDSEATWRSEDVSSDVTSLTAVTSPKWTTPRRSGGDSNGSLALLGTARQLIAELQAMLPDDVGGSGIRRDSGGGGVRSAMEKESGQTVTPRRPSDGYQQEQHDQQQQQQQSYCELQQQPPSPAALDLQACNGLCVVFANFSSFLPAGEAASDRQDDEAADDRQRAGQIRDAAAAVGQLFNSRLEFTVLIHWNKPRREAQQLLRQAAALMSDSRDSCFAFFLGRGGRGHFEAACGGSVTLTDILATLAVGQRSRLPAFVFGDLARSTVEPQQDACQARLALPSNQLLLWTLGAAQTTDMLVEQLTRSHLSGGKDVASTVAGIAEWIRRSGKAGGGSCRFLSKLDRLVYLASPDCI